MNEQNSNLEVEDYEECYECEIEIAELQKRREERERQLTDLKMENDWKERLLIELQERYPHGATPNQFKEHLFERRLKKDRELFPDKIFLSAHKDAPYPIYPVLEKEGSLADQLCLSMGIVSGEDCKAFEDIDTIRILQESIPENTLRAYRGDIRYMGAWFLAMGEDFRRLITEDLIVRFIIDHLEGFASEKAQEVELRLIKQGFKAKAGPHSFDTIKRRLAAFSNYCKAKGWENPVRNERVRLLLRQLSKSYSSTNQPTAITRNTLIHFLDKTSSDTIGVRDRALLSFMFSSGGRRRAEVEEALIEDLEDQGDCFLFHLRRSKTNKTGKSEPKPVAGLAAKYLREWLEVLGESSGPLFRPVTKKGGIKSSTLKGVFISRIVKALAIKAGYDPKKFSAHSLRSGFVSQAAREGCSMPEVKALTGHKTDAMVSRYYQQGDVLRSKAGNLL